MTFKAPSTGPTYLRLVLGFAGKADSAFDLGPATATGWQTTAVTLPSNMTGDTIVRIDLQIQPPTAVPKYQVRIGQPSVTDRDVTPIPPTGLTVLGAVNTGDNTQTNRLRWTASPSAVHHYNVYRKNPDQSRTRLGGTSNGAYFVPRLQRVGGESATIIDVETVGMTFTRSSAVSIMASWQAAGSR